MWLFQLSFYFIFRVITHLSYFRTRRTVPDSAERHFGRGTSDRDLVQNEEHVPDCAAGTGPLRAGD